MFQHRNIHKYTWTSPDGKTYNQIDQILKDRRWPLLKYRACCYACYIIQLTHFVSLFRNVCGGCAQPLHTLRNSSQTDLPLTRAPSPHTSRWYTHTATYQVNTQRRQISGRHYSNGTKHGIWPPEDGRIKRTETCRGFLVFTKCFNILVFLNVKVSVF